ncbi:hypothetical protein MLD38_011519 [Melastoma candidum]|uniref:Uncharacterized protein n=1 Tax=Melastoma candidum TaxID=119954 RepID=A0ACB9R3C3_9MYRT|nr:hypothetical protein MLD38_011519 [Melastoma candidum]
MTCTVATICNNSPAFCPSPRPPTPHHLKGHSPASPRSFSPLPNDPPAIPKRRKRPARLIVPAADVSFPDCLQGTNTPSSREEQSGDCGYWVRCKRGRRDSMEDRYSVLFLVQDDPKQAIFGVFDGHGGSMAAEFAAKNLDKNIVNQVVPGEGTGLEESVKRAYLKTDSDFLCKDVGGGSCCLTAFIRNGELLVSNAGDCRAVVSRDGSAEDLTSDHRPSREDERLRIEAQGGYVDLRHGVWRIQGSLAVSRGIGDSSLKKWVIAEPETKRLRIETDHEFLILASDGLWDKVPSQEAVDVARRFLVGGGKPEPMHACRKLVELSISRGSIDDISVMLVDLKRYI